MINALSSPESARLEDLDLLWTSDDPRASEAAYLKLLPEAETLADEDPSPLIEVLTQLARAAGAQGKLAEAHSWLERAGGIIEQQSAHRVSAKIRFLIEAGRLHILEKTPSQARPLFAEAWTLAINSGEDFFAVDVALMMAAIEPQKQQQEWIVRAIKLAEESPQPKTKRWLGPLYSALGWRFYDSHQYEASLELFQKALSHHRHQGSKRETFVAQWSIGKLLRTMGKTEEALAIQKALFGELGIGGARDGRVFEELAECLHTLKRTAEAQLYFELAYRELSRDEWMTDNQPVKLRRLKDLGKVK